MGEGGPDLKRCENEVTLGHNGILDPVALAVAELYAVRGDAEQAAAYLDRAEAAARRERGGSSVLRCRLLRLRLAAGAGALDAGTARDVAEEARRRGLTELVRGAEALAACRS